MLWIAIGIALAAVGLGGAAAYAVVSRWERCDHCKRRRPAGELAVIMGSAMCRDASDCMKAAGEGAR